VEVGALGELGEEGVEGQRPVVRGGLVGARGAGFRLGGARSGRLGEGGGGEEEAGEKSNRADHDAFQCRAGHGVFGTWKFAPSERREKAVSEPGKDRMERLKGQAGEPGGEASFQWRPISRKTRVIPEAVKWRILTLAE